MIRIRKPTDFSRLGLLSNVNLSTSPEECSSTPYIDTSTDDPSFYTYEGPYCVSSCEARMRASNEFLTYVMRNISYFLPVAESLCRRWHCSAILSEESTACDDLAKYMHDISPRAAIAYKCEEVIAHTLYIAKCCVAGKIHFGDLRFSVSDARASAALNTLLRAECYSGEYAERRIPCFTPSISLPSADESTEKIYSIQKTFRITNLWRRTWDGHFNKNTIEYSCLILKQRIFLSLTKDTKDCPLILSQFLSRKEICCILRGLPTIDYEIEMCGPNYSATCNIRIPRGKLLSSIGDIGRRKVEAQRNAAFSALQDILNFPEMYGLHALVLGERYSLDEFEHVGV